MLHAARCQVAAWTKAHDDGSGLLFDFVGGKSCCCGKLDHLERAAPPCFDQPPAIKHVSD